MSALDELLRLPTRLENPYVEQWKADGGRVVGFVCGYVPEEIIHAAGLFPYRMEARGTKETGRADVYMHRFNCTFARCLLEAGLAGDYDFLDGFCFLNGCEQIRRIYEIWDKHVPATDYQYMISVPHSLSDGGYDWYKEELFNFKEKLMNDFGVNLTNNSLKNSIEIYNESRRLIGDLYDLRKSEELPINGSDALRILLSAGIMPREKFNELLSEALKEIKGKAGTKDYKARLMAGGSALDDPNLMEVIEDLGGQVVTDSLCFGSRHFMNQIEQNGDPFAAITKRYYYHNPCPRMLGEFDSRLEFTEQMAKGADVDGVLLQKIVFCDNHGVDSPMLADELEEKGMPVLVLEREYMLSDVGRLKTRIEAFLERIARR